MNLGAVVTSFKKHTGGFSLTADAASLLLDIVNALDDPVAEVQDEMINSLAARLEVDELDSTFVSRGILETLIRELEDESEVALDRAAVRVISAFDAPAVTYDDFRARFIVSPAPPRSAMLSTTCTRTTVLRHRCAVVRGRLLRDSHFRRVTDTSKTNAHALVTVDTLAGSRGPQLLLGMLLTDDEGRPLLEDPVGRVPIDLSGAKRTGGLFTEGSLVLIHGTFDGERLIVDTMGFPPPEPRERALTAFPHDTDVFGARAPPRLFERLRAYQLAEENRMLLVLSDVWLDRPDVHDRLAVLFSFYEPVTPPPVFLFCGDFVRPRGFGAAAAAVSAETLRALGDGFDTLAKSLHTEYPRLAKEAVFIFVPGPGDPTATGRAIPRAQLPAQVTQRFRDLIPHSQFTSNPCRLRYCAMEIVVLRENLLAAMRASCVVPPLNDEEIVDLEHHLIRTILDQGHLYPLPLLTHPVFWAFDHALSLHTLPDLLILADRAAPYDIGYLDQSCLAVNPSCFAVDYSFLTVRLATRECELSNLGGARAEADSSDSQEADPS